ncbi:MAG: protein kinase [Polyangiaceae bacterium]|nr:protein kinase [Polyangiaceae bacterium]
MTSERAEGTRRFPDFPGCEVEALRHRGPVVDEYLAVQRVLGRAVVVRALGAGLLPTSPVAAIVEHEARILAKLRHEGVPTLHDFVREAQRAWLVLERCDGPTLTDLVAARGVLPARATLGVLLALARTLAHLHEHGVVLRVLRPEHVRVLAEGRVVLDGFGHAVSAGERRPPAELAATSADVVSVYAAPEVRLEEPCDGRTDLYSLACIAAAIVDGGSPGAASDARRAVRRAARDGVLPAAVAPLLDAALEDDRERRPADAASLVHALERALELTAGADLRDCVRGALAAPPASAPPPAPSARPARPGAAPPRVRWWWLAGAALAGAVAVEVGLVTRRLRAPAAEPSRSVALALAPASAGYLRVVAEPWAHVHVDGEHVDTTPFARALPLAAGPHSVRLTHPNAPDELRAVHIAPGATVSLDVRMTIDPAVRPPTQQRPVASVDAGTPSP